MSYKLSNGHYSASEQKLFALLGKRPTSSTDLLIKFYGGHSWPENGRIRMMNIMRSLQRKVNEQETKFQIVRSPRAGPNPVTFKLST